MTEPASHNLPWDDRFFKNLLDTWDRHEAVLNQIRFAPPPSAPAERPHRVLTLRKLGFRLGGDGIGSLLARFVFRSWLSGELPTLDVRFVSLDQDAVQTFEREIAQRMSQKGIRMALDPGQDPVPSDRSCISWGEVTRTLCKNGCLCILSENMPDILSSEAAEADEGLISRG